MLLGTVLMKMVLTENMFFSLCLSTEYNNYCMVVFT